MNDEQLLLSSTDDAPDYTPFDHDAWAARGKELAKRDTDTHWALADWLIEGVENMPKIDNQGYALESYAYDMAETITGLSRSHPKDLVSTARRMPASVRTDALSWSHHRHLANLKPQATDDEKRELLAEAVAGGLSSKQFAAKLNPPTNAIASARKSFVVELPLAAYRTLTDLARKPGTTVQSVAAELLAKALVDPEVKAEAKAAKEAAEERLTERRRTVGSRMHRVNGLEGFHFGN